MPATGNEGQRAAPRLRVAREWARATLVSPEVAFAAAVSLVAAVWPTATEFVGETVSSLGLGWGLGLTAIPLGCLAWCYRAGQEMQRPEEHRAVLRESPVYVLLKVRVRCVLLFCLVGLLLLAAGSVLATRGSTGAGGALVAVGLGIPWIATGSLALAKWRLLEILDDVE